MEDLAIRQQTALQIASSSNKIATAEQLADLRASTMENGMHVYPRYKELQEDVRLSWLNHQFFGLALIAHVNIDPVTIRVDISTMDADIMSDPILKDLTLVEMQEAFKKGLNSEYGEYYGLSSVSLMKFLKGFLRSEKKASATAIFHRRRERAEREANSRFFKEMHEAQSAGKIVLPDFSENKVNGPQKKRIFTDEESVAHREKVRLQAEEIYRKAKLNKEDEAQEK